MNAKVAQIIKNPTFLNMPTPRQVKILNTLDSSFKELSPTSKIQVVEHIKRIGLVPSLVRGAREGIAGTMMSVQAGMERITGLRPKEPSPLMRLATAVAPKAVAPEREHQVGKFIGTLGTAVPLAMAQLAAFKRVPPVMGKMDVGTMKKAAKVIAKLPKATRPVAIPLARRAPEIAETTKMFGMYEALHTGDPIGGAVTGTAIGISNMPASVIGRVGAGVGVGFAEAAIKGVPSEEAITNSVIYGVFNILGRRHKVDSDKLRKDSIRENLRAHKPSSVEDAIGKAVEKNTGVKLEKGWMSQDSEILTLISEKLRRLKAESQWAYTERVPTALEIARHRYPYTLKPPKPPSPYTIKAEKPDIPEARPVYLTTALRKAEERYPEVRDIEVMKRLASKDPTVKLPVIRKEAPLFPEPEKPLIEVVGTRYQTGLPWAYQPVKTAREIVREKFPYTLKPPSPYTVKAERVEIKELPKEPVYLTTAFRKVLEKYPPLDVKAKPKGLIDEVGIDKVKARIEENLVKPADDFHPAHSHMATKDQNPAQPLNTIHQSKPKPKTKRTPKAKLAETLDPQGNLDEGIIMMHAGIPLGDVVERAEGALLPVKNFVRLPYYKEGPLYDFVRCAMAMEDEANEAAFKAALRMKKYFELKDKSMANEVIIHEDMHNIRIPKKQLKEWGLTNAEIEAVESYHKGLDYLALDVTRKMFMRAGLSYKEADEIAKAHYLEGYMPHYRYGNFGALVKEGDDSIFLEGASTRAKAQAILDERQRLGKIPEGATTAVVDLRQVNIHSDYVSSLLMSQQVMRKILKEDFPVEIKWMTDILGQEGLKRFAGGKWAHRDRIEGYSLDVERAARKFISEYPHSLARKTWLTRLEAEIEKIPKYEDKMDAKGLLEYIMGARQREGIVNLGARQLIYLWHLAAKPSFGIVNLIQRLQNTFWLATARGGMIEGAKAFGKAQTKELSLVGDMINKRIGFADAIRQSRHLSRREKWILLKARQEGEIQAVWQKELIGSNNRFMRAVNIFGAASERSNRVQALLTAAEIYKGLPHKQLYQRTKEFTWDSQFPFRKATRPKMGRGALAIPYVFKGFMVHRIGFLAQLFKEDKKSFTGAIATSLGLGGLYGIIGIKTAEEILDFAMPHFNPQWQLDKAEFLAKIPDFVEHGLPHLIGIEGSANFGEGELFGIAGWPILKRTHEVATGKIWRPSMDVSTLLEEMFEKELTPSADAIQQQAVEFADVPEDLGIVEIIRRLSPRIVQHELTLYFMEKEGEMPLDLSGKARLTIKDIKKLPAEVRARALEIFNELPTHEDFPTHEKVLYAMGFSCPTLNKYYRNIQTIKKLGRDMRRQKAAYHKRIGERIGSE